MIIFNHEIVHYIALFVQYSLLFVVYQIIINCIIILKIAQPNIDIEMPSKLYGRVSLKLQPSITLVIYIHDENCNSSVFAPLEVGKEKNHMPKKWITVSPELVISPCSLGGETTPILSCQP